MCSNTNTSHTTDLDIDESDSQWAKLIKEGVVIYPVTWVVELSASLSDAKCLLCLAGQFTLLTSVTALSRPRLGIIM